MANIHVKTGSWDRLGQDATYIRHAVFIVEQGVAPSLEQDPHDYQYRHAVAYNAGHQPVGTGRLQPTGVIGRMAVLPAYREQGIGGVLLMALLQEARRHGLPMVELAAQVQAQSFYEKQGFVAHGSVFLEAGMPHIKMRRVLTK